MLLIGHASHGNTEVAIAAASAEFRASKPKLLLIFAGGRHAAEAVIWYLSRTFPGVPIVGGSVVGTITPVEAGYAGFGISIVAFLDPELSPSVFHSMPGSASDFGRAHALGRRVAAASPTGQSAILLYDSVLSSDPTCLHHGSAIASGFERGLGTARLEFVGAGLLTSPNLDNSWVCAGKILKHAIVALVFPPALTLETVILPGSRSTGMSVQITAVVGDEIQELDGRPAYEVICEALGRANDGGNNVLALNVSLGGSDVESEVVGYPGRNRLILREDRARGTITLFEPDFRLGDRVDILLQDSDYMLRAARRLTGSLQDARGHEAVALCLYLDCAGRSRALTGAMEEEALVVMAGLPPSWPKIGGYTGVEIARVAGGYKALDLTGVLAVFRMR